METYCETLFDSHCHLTDPRFADDLEQVIENSHCAGVTQMVLVGTDLLTSRQSIALAKEHEGCYATIGIAPHEAAKSSFDDVEELTWLARKSKVVAIGETGLEYHYDVVPPDIQQRMLRLQLQQARRLNLPVIFHHREADRDFMQIVDEEGLPQAGGIMHCFTGSSQLLEWAVERGLYLSFSGIVTFKNATELRDLAVQVPERRLLIETDAPYLAPEPMRGRRCEPSMLVETARALATTLDLSLQDIARITRRNAMRLFRLPDPDPPKIAYAIGRALYLNITNDCSNRCTFCVRFQGREMKGHKLDLYREPNLDEVIEAIQKYRLSDYQEVVFCGFGEPTCRMDLLVDIADYLKLQEIPVRLNTNGQGNLINQCDIVPDLVGRVDRVSVSLNCADPEQYQRLCRSDFGTQGWHAMTLFIQKCVAADIDTQVTVVDLPDEDLKDCQALAEQLGVALYHRIYRKFDNA